MYKVDLTYFHYDGKYYSSGSFRTNSQKTLTEIWAIVAEMNRVGGLPGIMKTSKNWIVAVHVDYWPQPHTNRLYLIFPDKLVGNLKSKLEWRKIVDRKNEEIAELEKVNSHQKDHIHELMRDVERLNDSNESLRTQLQANNDFMFRGAAAPGKPILKSSSVFVEELEREIESQKKSAEVAKMFLKKARDLIDTISNARTFQKVGQQFSAMHDMISEINDFLPEDELTENELVDLTYRQIQDELDKPGLSIRTKLQRDRIKLILADFYYNIKRRE